jgi:hypothetical protein
MSCFLIVNQGAINHPDNKTFALCDYAGPYHKIAKAAPPKPHRPVCGCNKELCSAPPTCPTEVGEDCKGAVYFPFLCDCQFCWIYDASLLSNLAVCIKNKFKLNDDKCTNYFIYELAMRSGTLFPVQEKL